MVSLLNVIRTCLMNELFAVEPSTFKTASELKYFLKLFGPFAGRYIEEYPSKEWVDVVIQHFANVGELEKERVKSVLRRAREESCILNIVKNREWNPSESWIANAESWMANGRYAPINKPPFFSNLILSGHEGTEGFGELSPTAEERIKSSSSEYRRVCDILLHISYELYFIDPYLKITNRRVKDVISALLENLLNGKCEKVTFITRASGVFENANRNVFCDDIETELKRIAKNNLKRGTIIKFLFVRDEESQFKMHARYLLSIKGAVRLDQGFQSLPDLRKVDVSPVSKKVHDELCLTFIEGKNDFEITNCFEFTV